MKTKDIIKLLLASSIACACSSGGDDNVPDGQEPTPPTTHTKLPINISTELMEPNGTRVTDYSFESGDKIGLFVVNRTSDGSAAQLKPTGNHVDNMPFTYNGTWTPATPIYWLDDKTHADFYLYYPYTPSLPNVENMPFKVNSDQSTEGAYKASDLLAGSSKDIAPTDKAITILAKHLLSQMIVKIVPGNGFTAESLAAANVSVRINNVKTNATVNIAKATVSASGATSNITPLKTAQFTYKALIVPQSVPDGNLISVTVDGREFNLPKAFTFISGKMHRFTVTLSKTSNGINVSIGQWEDDGTDNGGTAE